jgi:glutamate-1-semialdehyde 2,1-aminomutase/spore coat polysaccharide biosynthesis protein SpsF
VTPDLACFGKAMANGLPLSALVGRREIMKRLEEVFFSFTFGGETLSLAASLATVKELRAQPVIRHLWAQGKQLQDGFNILARHLKVERHARCAGLPPRTLVLFADEQGRESLTLKSLFQQECCKRGVLFTGAHNLSWGHGQAEIDQTLRVYRDALRIVAEALREGDVERRLEGPPLQPVFRNP